MSWHERRLHATDVEAAVVANLPGGVLRGQTALVRLKVERAKGELRISAL